MKTIVLSVAIVFLSVIGSMTFLIADGKDASQIVGFLAPYLTLVIPVLLNTFTLKRIDGNVNGHLSDLSRAAGLKPGEDIPPEPPTTPDAP